MPTTLERTRDAALALLPPGRAFSRLFGSGVVAFVEGAVVRFAEILDQLDVVDRNSVPSDADELLPEWEAALGLPEECMPVPSTLEARQLALVEKLRGRSDFSPAGWEAFCGLHGYTIYQLIKYAPFEVGISSVGAPLFGDAWMHTFLLRVAERSNDPGAQASGQAIFDGVTDTEVPEGTQMFWVGNPAIVFETTALATVVDSVLVAPIQAVAVGVSGNVANYETLELAAPIEGISLQGYAYTLSGGVDSYAFDGVRDLDQLTCALRKYMLRAHNLLYVELHEA